MAPPRVMVVEDEEPLAVLLQYNLEAEGFEVETVARGDEADLRLQECVPDLLLLDWMLPGTSGIELCRRVRARPATAQLPVIMLTARGEESERVRGLATGADDYVVKPFSTPELIARIRATLRRTNPATTTDTLSVGELTLDRATHKVTRKGRTLRIAPTEFRLLEHLMTSRGRVQSRAQLLDAVWRDNVEIDERTVDVHIGRLRRAIVGFRETDPSRTVRGVGYALEG